MVAFRADIKKNGNNVVQVYDLSTLKPLKKVQISGKFAYWSWVSPNILAFITNQAIYHLDITKGQ